MKARAVILSLFLSPILLNSFSLSQTNGVAYLKECEIQQTKIRTGFVTNKSEVIFEEPLQASFLVENIGTTNFEFWFGGDYRGTGRHDRFKIAVTNELGDLLPDPIAHPMDFGGMMQHVKLAPGQRFTNVVRITDFRVIDKPGTYTVSCSFSFDEQWRQNRTNCAVNTTYTLKTLERTPGVVAKVLDDLVARAKVQQGEQLRDTLALIARFGKDAAVSRLQQLITNGPIELRVAAIGVLPQIPADDTLEIALTNLHDADQKIRSAAAGALGAMQKPAGVQALLGALPNSTLPASGDILRALGTSKSELAFPVISQSLDAGGLEIQRAAIDALVNFGGSNAAAVLQQHINTNFLSIRYELVLALAEELRQPMQAEWLLPVLAGREQDHEWLDSLRLLRMYGGDKAIPTMLSCLDFDAAWSGRNRWILETGVKPCSHAPPCDYQYDPNSSGTPEQREKNLRILQSLKPFAGHSAAPRPSHRSTIPYLKTEPPIDFVPVFKVIEDDGVEIKSGFLTIKLYRNSESDDFTPAQPFKAVYELAARIRGLPNGTAEKAGQLNLSPEQKMQIAMTVKQFAMKLCGAKVSDLCISNFYNLLANNADYCPTGAAFFGTPLRYYQEAPDGPLKEQAKFDFVDEVRRFSQDYHAGTVELVQNAKKILTKEQINMLGE